MGSAPVILNAVAAILVNQKSEVLLQLRGDSSSENWGLPGGIVEVGESLCAALGREVFEETGINIRRWRPFGVYEGLGPIVIDNGDIVHMIAHLYIVEAFDGEPKCDGKESAALRFFPLSDRPKMFREHLEKALLNYQTEIDEGMRNDV